MRSTIFAAVPLPLLALGNPARSHDDNVLQLSHGGRVRWQADAPLVCPRGQVSKHISVSVTLAEAQKLYRQKQRSY